MRGVAGEPVTYSVRDGEVVVTARSSIHDTTATWSIMTGTITVVPTQPDAQPSAEIQVDMRIFDAGDRLKNWKLKSELDAERFPFAKFRLSHLEDLRTSEGQRFEAGAVGTLSWRGRDVPLRTSGWGEISPLAIRAEAEFELDVRELGVQPPRILMFKVDNRVRVRVRVRANA